jgi:hypothetical protein
MNVQAADINVLGSKATTGEVIRCGQLTGRYTDANIATAYLLDSRAHVAGRRSAKC